MPTARRSSSRSGFSLTNPTFLAGKAGAACAIAIGLARVFDNPDLITCAFVAVLCCSPAVLMGVRTSLDQLVGSMLGGTFGALAIRIGLPAPVGVPLAVTTALAATHAMGFARGATAAAFTAIFVQIVVFGSTLSTFAFRLEAVTIAGVSAMTVNLLVSSLFYDHLFRKRMQRVEGYLAQLVGESAVRGPSVFEEIFAVLVQLDRELDEALREARFRRVHHTVEILDGYRVRLRWLHHYAHLLVGLDFDPQSSADDIRAFLRWLDSGEGEAPALTGDAGVTRDRILSHLSTSA